ACRCVRRAVRRLPAKPRTAGVRTATCNRQASRSWPAGISVFAVGQLDRTLSLDHARIANGHRTVGDRRHDDASRADNAIVANVGHYDRAIADPGIASNANLSKLARLLLDRQS